MKKFIRKAQQPVETCRPGIRSMNSNRIGHVFLHLFCKFDEPINNRPVDRFINE
ncbi:MAG: hypothetical protein FWH05_09485 [Oscillospiraceae bacterium]|nr:hypothetical protein [Oscillospiraceae bacterium]